MVRTAAKRAKAATTPAARGSTIMATLEFLSSEKSPAMVRKVLDRLSKDERATISSLAATEEVDRKSVV